MLFLQYALYAFAIGLFVVSVWLVVYATKRRSLNQLIAWRKEDLAALERHKRVAAERNNREDLKIIKKEMRLNKEELKRLQEGKL